MMVFKFRFLDFDFDCGFRLVLHIKTPSFISEKRKDLDPSASIHPSNRNKSTDPGRKRLQAQWRADCRNGSRHLYKACRGRFGKGSACCDMTERDVSLLDKSPMFDVVISLSVIYPLPHARMVKISKLCRPVSASLTSGFDSASVSNGSLLSDPLIAKSESPTLLRTLS